MAGLGKERREGWRAGGLLVRRGGYGSVNSSAAVCILVSGHSMPFRFRKTQVVKVTPHRYVHVSYLTTCFTCLPVDACLPVCLVWLSAAVLDSVVVIFGGYQV